MSETEGKSGKSTTMVTDNTNEIEEKAIGKFDEWFRYAETIGQQRLGSYLFTSSITLSAFAILYSRDIFLLSLLIALFGAVFSFIWAVIGTRQGKFHQKMETQIDYWLQAWEEKNNLSPHKKNIQQFPIWHVRHMKKDLDRQSDTKLNRLEHIFMTRRFLWIVPSLLCFVYILCLVFALRRLSIPYFF